MTSYPLRRESRRKYDFHEPRFADILLARRLATQINAERDLENEPQRAVYAGTLVAASLLDEIFSYLIARYLEEVHPRALDEAATYIEDKLGKAPFDALLEVLRSEFDPPETTPSAFEYLIRLRLCNANQALENLHDLFNDRSLPQPNYSAALADLRGFFDAQPKFGPDDQNLLDFLFAPLHAHSDSVDAQLRYMIERWTPWLEPFLNRILFTLDVISEETKPVFHGPGPAQVLDYKRAVGMDEYEAFSPDKAWMPSVVLLAKNTYVWLDQLSKKYERHIHRLDQVPDEELDEMAARGFSGLWLIGLWQRSKASQKVKQMCGNPDAVASAYSLHAYDIAWELGGQEAMDDLCKRAAKRGVRMASDMVPNHMAIDSQWIMDHPEYFLSIPHNPYPQYNFEGPDLSEDGRCSIYLENHYYSQSDAAVVFRRVDNQTGEERYIYHGNDGTSMPWNDTAQLNYLKAEVREAVIQTILHVARQFPIIRFDAAMTLAKRHYHRLWFPAPGEGGAIPTRAGNGLTADEFDAAMPQEFWREVVDRVAAEVPDTLLLAEAFWLMEGYFVRTLGMHRVYNSAFMNMLRDEKNAEYRLTLKNTLEFDPDILGRFVNFMNNPDEKTSVEQFGKGDKYFGVCTLLATLPGLPMFGHGQIEGYAEKYGMEYPRAYWDEQPDEELIARHQKEIFPLLHKRAMFAGSENFTLYDFWANRGEVNEDVFAYSNRMGNDRALVIFNNKFGDTAGWIRSSVSFAQKDGDSKTLRQRTLGEALGLAAGDRAFCIFRDNVSGLEYLRSSRELVENGLFVQLQGYGCHVFLDWREVRDEAGLYKQLAQHLHGRGTPSVETALRELLLEPIHTPFGQVADAELWKQLWSAKSTRGAKASQALTSALDGVESRMHALAKTALEFAQLEGDATLMAQQARTRVQEALQLSSKIKPSLLAASELEKQALLLTLALVSPLGAIGANEENKDSQAKRSRVWFDEWLLSAVLDDTLREFGLKEGESARVLALARVLLAHVTRPANQKLFEFVTELFGDAAAQTLLGMNRFEGVTYFNKEGFEETLVWLGLLAPICHSDIPRKVLCGFAETSGYRVVRFLELCRETKPVGTRPAVSATRAKKADTAGRVPTTKSKKS